MPGSNGSDINPLRTLLLTHFNSAVKPACLKCPSPVNAFLTFNIDESQPCGTVALIESARLLQFKPTSDSYDALISPISRPGLR